MGKDLSTLIDWPRTRAGIPIFQSTEQAHYFANLIFYDEKQIKLIRKIKDNTRQEVAALRKQGNQPFNKVFPLACKAQFYRECLEELDRIHNDKFTA